MTADQGKRRAPNRESFLSITGTRPYALEPCGHMLPRLHCITDAMGTGVSFIFQTVLLLVLPLAVVYLFCVAGLVIMSIRALIFKKQPRDRRSDFPSKSC